MSKTYAFITVTLALTCLTLCLMILMELDTKSEKQAVNALNRENVKLKDELNRTIQFQNRYFLNHEGTPCEH
jgi:predicted membrane protein